jgi:1-acyl-sn-glycerol-3-phosphate acyltransferase
VSERSERGPSGPAEGHGAEQVSESGQRVPVEATREELPLPKPAGPPSFGQLVAYHAVRGTLLGFARLFWRLDVRGLEHVPKEGSYIVAPVHRSNADFALVLAVSRRRMRYMGKAGIWKYKALWPVFDALGGFPVSRGSADRAALRTCIEVIKTGEPLVLFPEGTRQSGPTVEALFDGVAYVASKTGVPIIPVGIGGSERALAKGKKLPRLTKVTVLIGPAMVVETTAEGKVPRRAVKETTEVLKAEVQRLFDEAQVAAGA